MVEARRRGDWRWVVAGAVLMIVAVLLLYRYQAQGSRLARLAEQHRRLDLVERMATDLARASEAEKNAVMADTDERSRAFAAEARAGTAAVRQAGDELARLLAASDGERELLSRFTGALTEYERLDQELLELAVRNTNLKAYDLAFGPAADAAREAAEALTRLLTRMADSSSPHARRIMVMAAAAQGGVLRSQALLPAHIAEDDSLRMNELERDLAAEDQRVRTELENLRVLVPLAAKSDLAAAATAYGRFAEQTARIVELSRQNTNVRSLALSLNQKRRVVLACQEALATLEQAIRGEPVPRAPANPR